MVADSDHVGDKDMRRSRTGFMVFTIMALICWFSNEQPTIKSSVFGTEFVAMKHVVETLRGLCYKLRMVDVHISGPSFVYVGNTSVIYNPQ